MIVKLAQARLGEAFRERVGEGAGGGGGGDVGGDGGVGGGELRGGLQAGGPRARPPPPRFRRRPTRAQVPSFPP